MNPGRPRRITPDMLAGPRRPSPRSFEEGMTVLPPVALGLMALNALAFVWTLPLDRAGILAAGAVSEAALYGGEPWRLLTAMFLHLDAGHLAGNLAGLYIFGAAAEKAWGRYRLLLIYFAGGLFASLVSAHMQSAPAAGASGAVFALAASLAVFFSGRGAPLSPGDRRVGVWMLLWLAWSFHSGLGDAGVDNWGHFGGMAAGAALARVLRARS